MGRVFLHSGEEKSVPDPVQGRSDVLESSQDDLCIDVLDDLVVQSRFQAGLAGEYGPVFFFSRFLRHDDCHAAGVELRPSASANHLENAQLPDLDVAKAAFAVGLCYSFVGRVSADAAHLLLLLRGLDNHQVSWQVDSLRQRRGGAKDGQFAVQEQLFDELSIPDCFFFFFFFS